MIKLDLSIHKFGAKICDYIFLNSQNHKEFNPCVKNCNFSWKLPLISHCFNCILHQLQFQISGQQKGAFS